MTTDPPPRTDTGPAEPSPDGGSAPADLPPRTGTAPAGSPSDGGSAPIAPPAADAPTADPGHSGTRRRVDAVTARYTRTRARLDASAAGHLQRRIVEVDLANQALILAALAFMLLVPALVSLQAVIPLGATGGGLTDVARRLGLTDQATSDLQTLFPGREAVRGATTLFGAILTLVSAFSWPAALQRGYELAWGLPSAGWRALWRPLLWLGTFAVFGSLWGLSGPLVTGWVRAIVPIIIGLPIAIGWAWWTQHLLLGGRIGWRPLLPGAIAIGIGLLGLRIAASLYLSRSIVSHHREYGPLGIVFVLLSWLVAFGVVMLGGALLGVFLREHRQRRALAASSSPAGDDADPTPPQPQQPQQPQP
ncbi:YhjD/YihY/BrkB family envelope integrity protein [Pseudonocardia sp. D17]|uniref:YhjD/YihY/BrkB family envelope integrity protein n=1 Tax=Pseudonocardia sp. D17 TaxID=882661 RepID=UPI002B365FAB|nr:hypothetical protein PSD17_51370 [Pseudonocardia sp. D17]